MKTLAIIAALVAVSIAAFLAYAATKPDSFRVERATSIDAPPEKVFALINDLRVGGLVAVGEEGPRDEADLQRPGERQGRPTPGKATATSARAACRSSKASPPSKVGTQPRLFAANGGAHRRVRPRAARR